MSMFNYNDILFRVYSKSNSPIFTPSFTGSETVDDVNIWYDGAYKYISINGETRKYLSK